MRQGGSPSSLFNTEHGLSAKYPFRKSCIYLSSQDRGVQHEVEPMCVLDFYVHESRQRSGCGKKLYEAMMEVFKAAVAE